MLKRNLVIAFALIIIAFGVTVYKVQILGYQLVPPPERSESNVALTMELVASGRDVSVRTYIPTSNSHQTISDVNLHAGSAVQEETESDEGRQISWKLDGLDGRALLEAQFTARTQEIRYQLPEALAISSVPRDIARYLIATDRIQSDSPEIAELLGRIAPDRNNAVEVVKACYHHIRDTIMGTNYVGTTDALTCLRLKRGSCNGKSRLFIALLRQAGIPARMVGGLILEQTSKRTTHAWVEVWLGGQWVPFDTLNGHFARLPANYLTLNRGDLPLFLHTRDIEFDYIYEIGSREYLSAEDRSYQDAHPLNVNHLIARLKRAEIDLALLEIMLLLPLGAFIVAVMRNIVGIPTFGVFIPALLAVAFRVSGFAWGMAMFLAVLLTGQLVRASLQRLHLTHTPRLAIVIMFVVLFILALMVIGIEAGVADVASISLFPMIILTTTIERAYQISTETGMRKVLATTAGTALVTAMAFTAMNVELFKMAVMAFPELLVALIGALILLGSYSGLRLTEVWRFRDLIRQERQATRKLRKS